MRIHFALASAAVLILAGCDRSAGPSAVMSPTSTGSGHMHTESRAVTGVTSVTVGSGAELTIERGGTESLTITAADNMMDGVLAEMMNGRLMLGMRGDMPMHMTQPVRFHLTIHDMHDIVCSGGAHVQLSDVDTTRLVVMLSGGSTLTASGRADSCEANLSGGSRCDAPMLRTRSMIAHLSGGSVGTVRVSDSLTAAASGASVLDYFGDPFVDAHTSAASTIRRVGP
jgi:hypothetical protein